jgi:hypothetical protein
LVPPFLVPYLPLSPAAAMRHVAVGIGSIGDFTHLVRGAKQIYGVIRSV